MPLYQVNAGDRILAADINQFYQLLKGVAASGESVSLIYNAAAALVFQPSSDPSAGTEVIQIKNNTGTVQGSVTYDGKFKAADGTAIIPGIRFQSEASGLYLSSAGVLGLTVAGVSRATLASTGLTIANGLIVSGGGATVAGSPTGYTGDELKFSTATGGVGSAISTFSTGTPLLSFDHRGTSNTGTFSWRNNGANNTLMTLSNAPALTIGSAAAGGGTVIVGGTITAGGALTTALQVNTSGPLIYSGSGVPTISAAVKGSLYLRTDGSSGTTRAYIATDTAGTWTAISTVA